MRRVWVIDNLAVVADSVAALLAVHGFETMTLASAGEAIDALNTGPPPDTAVLDISMTDDGNDFLEFLLGHIDYTFPVIVLSGDPASIRRSAAGRVFSAIAKPCDPLALVAEVRRSVGHA